MRKTYFDRIIEKELFDAGEFLKVIGVLLDNDFELVGQKNSECESRLLFEYKGKRSATIQYVEIPCEYTEKFEDLYKNGYKEDADDWLSYAQEGIWNAFSDIVSFYGINTYPYYENPPVGFDI